MTMMHRSVHGVIFKLLWLFLITLTTTSAAAKASKRPSYYEILGVDKSVDDKDLKKAYRKASLKYHPDKKGGSEDKFKEINQAYDTLSDPQKRQVYDLYGEAGIESGAGSGGPDATSYGFSPGGGGNPFFGGAGGGDGTSPFQSFFTGQDGTKFQQRGFNFGGGANDGGMNIHLSDLLRHMMGGQGMGGGERGGFSGGPGPSHSQQPNQKPKSYRRKLKCTLEDLATGKTKKMKVTFGQNEKIYSIPIKPGWKSGTKVTFNGNKRPGGIRRMVFEVEELPHKYLKRNGDDLVYICRISEDQARRGGIKIKVPLPTGDTWTHVFPRNNNGTISNGQRHIEANKGMPIKGGPERGK
eukprot:CAMPEP_0113498804 /NCGR_PEP_ID=MMETSP0014_2-20120614/31386_1 /TAXON_ID=2857 /ORGANISM="Nitzschia sp." /LENGTH=353 /DNA_ID=CAMNT_0000392889 /DNA_START=236 /DNA_END=1295 /DNA_ORIENTATION=+ /assembly_acc=CAM_ASM_000159